MRRVCSIDYGLDMLAALFIAVDGKGHAYVYDEIYKSGLVVSAAAKEILSKADGVDIFIAPSDLWSRQKDSGRSMAELFGENGVYLTKLSSERIQGWSCLKEWLKVTKEPDGTRRTFLHITRRCANLLRCLPLCVRCFWFFPAYHWCWGRFLPTAKTTSVGCLRLPQSIIWA